MATLRQAFDPGFAPVTATEQLQEKVERLRHDLRAPLVNICGFAGEINNAVSDLTALVEQYGDSLPVEFRNKALSIFQDDLHPCLEFLSKAAVQLDSRIDDLATPVANDIK